MTGQLTVFDLNNGPKRPCDYSFKRYVGQKVHTRNHGIRTITEIKQYYTYLSGNIVGTPTTIWPVEDEE